jgi:hypothetical protein
VRLALPAPLVPPALREHKVSKVPSVRRVPSGSEGRLVLWDRLDRSDRRVRREKPVAKAQLDPPASADRQDRKAPPAHLAPPDQPVQRVTPAWQRQLAWLRVRIAFAARTMKSWLVLFVGAVRPTERSAQPLARQQPVYVYVGDLGSILAKEVGHRRAPTGLGQTGASAAPGSALPSRASSRA